MHLDLPGEVFYRYEDVQYAASLDEWENPVGEGELRVRLLKYTVLRHTPKGTWVGGAGWSRFVRREATKRFALPTIEEARESFVKRKQKQISIYTHRIARAKRALELINMSKVE